MMTTDLQKKILDLCLGKISKNEFLRFFPQWIAVPESYVLSELESAFSNQDATALEFAILFGFQFGFSMACAKIFNGIMCQDWHTQHENIAMIMKDLKCPDSVECLYQAALINFPYLEYDESYALGVKCIYALRAIGTDSAKEKLAFLAMSDNSILSERASKLLEAM